MAGPAQGQHFYTFSKEGKQNETYTRHTRVVRLGRFARRRNDHSLDTDSQRNNEGDVMKQCDYCDGHGVIEDWHCLCYPSGKVYDKWKEIIPCPKCKD